MSRPPKSDVATETNGGGPFPGAAHKITGGYQVCKENQDVRTWSWDHVQETEPLKGYFLTSMAQKEVHVLSQDAFLGCHTKTVQHGTTESARDLASGLSHLSWMNLGKILTLLISVPHLQDEAKPALPVPHFADWMRSCLCGESIPSFLYSFNIYHGPICARHISRC